MSNALFNSCSCGPGFQPQAGSGLYGSRYGLRRGLLYGLPCGSRYGLLHSLLRDLLHGLLCSVRHAFPLLLRLIPAFNTDFSLGTSARAQKRAAIYSLGSEKERTVENVGPGARFLHPLIYVVIILPLLSRILYELSAKCCTRGGFSCGPGLSLQQVRGSTVRAVACSMVCSVVCSMIRSMLCSMVCPMGCSMRCAQCFPPTLAPHLRF